MGKSSDRHWALLRMIPRAPQKISVASIVDRLEAAGYSITVRSVQRDLYSLSLRFPILGDNAKPQGWSFVKDVAPQVFPGLDSHARLATALARHHLKEALPRSALETLLPVLDALERSPHLESEGQSGLGHLVQIRSRHLQRVPAPIEDSIRQHVSDALIGGHKLSITYQRHGAQKGEQYEVNPLGLIIADALTYLVVTIEPYQDVRHLAVHRIVEAVPLPTKSVCPVSFYLRDHVDLGGLEIKHSSKDIRLKFRIRDAWAARLSESKLSANQHEKADGSGWTEISATITDSAQLRWWLRGYGADLEVLEPTYLRKEFIDDVKTLSSYYIKPAS